jgi:hypothetical protein
MLLYTIALLRRENEKNSRIGADFSGIITSPEGQQFVEMVAGKKLSPPVLTALGHRLSNRPDVLVNEERSLVWKLVGVKDIVALKNG